MSFLQSLDGKLSFVTTGGKALCLVNDRLHAGTNTDMEEETMVSKLAVYTGTILLALGASGARTADVITEAGALACVTDRWAETESGKRADYAGRCIVLPSDSAASKATETCTGTWEVMDDGGWKGAGTCTHVYKDGDDWSFEWQHCERERQNCDHRWHRTLRRRHGPRNIQA